MRCNEQLTPFGLTVAVTVMFTFWRHPVSMHCHINLAASVHTANALVEVENAFAAASARASLHVQTHTVRYFAVKVIGCRLMFIRDVRVLAAPLSETKCQRVLGSGTAILHSFLHSWQAAFPSFWTDFTDS